ncbi:hypothetical protein BO94DRAFT_536383 [Aspergillus sclerotioniger CBS 115572]|uniref:C2H2-type domain-containing protein n=1 Tax=Aspergillus sclerotioniger CBS 115572 TaxID=1450535 RepID=A0A317WBH9_9EURO|nr:hypothetical protein BO94DRAFT_536383 [Aspergillus sclerotioniger CBS 115572]PWY83693.1 hypothetical protein BO94DRAFT_536383 [Aspergillus sclerotioniger CBS 115572]
MPYYTCTQDNNDFTREADLIEHIRHHHYADFIRRPGYPGIEDSHGHMWYCFECDRPTSDHRSFDSDRAMLNHLRSCHGYFTDSSYED